ncbi:hypothetical protein KQH82_04870 [bacterium]|nr:hypothetical protein [bacterium]
MHALLTERSTEKCNEYVFNALLLIPDMYKRGRVDSVLQLIRFIESECDYRTFASLKTLISIQQGHFGGTLCDTPTVCAVVGDSPGYGCYGYFDSRDWYGSMYQGPPSQRYADFEDSLAGVLVHETDSTTVAHYWLRHFTGDDSFLLRHLKARDCPEQCLQDAYDALVARLLSQRYEARINLGVLTGVWLPQSEADVLGPKLEFGGQLGIYPGRFGLDATLLFRVLNAREDFVIVSDPGPDSGKSFFGGYVGLDGTYEVYRHDRHTFGLRGGTGYGWLGHVQNGDHSSRPNSNTFDFNLGCSYRLAYNKTRTRYVGLIFRYSVLNHATRGGSDLSGNAISLCLTYGWLSDLWPTRQLERLGYFD